MLQDSLTALPTDDQSLETREQRIETRIDLAEVLVDMGEYDEALSVLDALEIQTPETDQVFTSVAQQARYLNARGDVFTYLERDEQARQAYESALAFADSGELGETEKESTRGISIAGLGRLAYYAGDDETAEVLFDEAAELLLPALGESHPDSIWLMILLGAAAYGNGDLEKARSTWKPTLDTAERVLDPNNPNIGTLKNNLARVQFDLGDYSGAEPLLRDTLASDDAHRSEDFDDRVYPLSSLALIRAHEGDHDEAVDLLERALAIGEASGHRWLGPVLTNLADLKCKRGNICPGIELAARGWQVATAEFGEGQWQTAAAAPDVGLLRNTWRANKRHPARVRRVPKLSINAGEMHTSMRCARSDRPLALNTQLTEPANCP